LSWVLLTLAQWFPTFVMDTFKDLAESRGPL